jgi:hypothetical protein
MTSRTAADTVPVPGEVDGEPHDALETIVPAKRRSATHQAPVSEVVRRESCDTIPDELRHTRQEELEPVANADVCPEIPPPPAVPTLPSPPPDEDD